jgi:hypothetical protein
MRVSGAPFEHAAQRAAFDQRIERLLARAAEAPRRR